MRITNRTVGRLKSALTKRPSVSGATDVTDSVDLIPSLDRVFALAQRYPDKLILLDTKPGRAAPRMARQLMALFRRYPGMRSRCIVSNSDPKVLEQFQKEFATQPDFRDFKNFNLDKETLNDRNPSPYDLNPLRGSKDNAFVATGVPRHPLAGSDFYEAVRLVRKTRKAIDAPGSRYAGKQLITWTLNDRELLRRMFRARPHAVITAEPEVAHDVLCKLGWSKSDPARPKVIAHRGGGNLEKHPENSLGAVESGFQRADGIEIDVISAQDELLCYHDQDPGSLISVARNLGLEADHSWRPSFPYLGSPYRKPLSELKAAEIRQHYGYTRNLSRSLGLNLALNLGGQLLQAPLLLFR